MIRDTSRQAYREIKATWLPKKTNEVLMIFKKHGPMTSAECYQLLGWRQSDQRGNIRARVNDLVKTGALEELPYKRKCHVTGKTVHVWRWTGKEPRKPPKIDREKCPYCKGKGYTEQTRLF